MTRPKTRSMTRRKHNVRAALAGIALVAVLASLASPGCSATTRGDLDALSVGASSMRFCPEPTRLDLTLPEPRPLASDERNSSASAESSVLISPQPFNEVLVSWNIDAPKGTSARIDLRAGRPGFWSPWLYIGRVGDTPILGPRPQSFSGGKVDVDYFTSTQTFDRLQLRVTTFEPVSGPRVRVERLVVQPVDTRPAEPRDGGPSLSLATTPAPAPVSRIGVPFRSQKTPDPALAGRLCSPTSLAMVLAHRGLDHTVDQVARAAFDPDFNLYGNWPRNIQAASDFGAPGLLRRFSSWHDIDATLQRGQPIIASIQVDPGQLPAAPYAATDGHLIVIEGVDERGDLLVLDPAVATPEEGRRTYPRRDMTQVWLINGRGTAYVIEPATPRP